MSRAKSPSSPKITEAAWARQVRQLADMYGWRLRYHTHRSDRSDPGWPDEVLLHPVWRRVVFAELKTDAGRLRPEQRQWLLALAASGMEATLWRPRDVSTVIRVLSGAERASLPEVVYESPVRRAKKCPTLI